MLEDAKDPETKNLLKDFIREKQKENMIEKMKEANFSLEEITVYLPLIGKIL